MKIINGDEIRRKVRESFANDSQIGKTIALLIDELVDQVPALNVRQGFWIHKPALSPYCSECGEHSDDADARDAAYCHHCGAIMDRSVAARIIASNGGTPLVFGKWKHQGKGATFPWLCGACGVYQCDNPIHFCPECKTDMELPVEKSYMLGVKHRP